ncbi:K(+)-transporting ATPase subunit F [Calidifontibacter terrae]
MRSATGGQALPGVMVENLAAAFVALALVGYLLYALIRPDRF